MPQDPSQLVNVTILFADLVDSVRISSVLDFWAYDDLIGEYQQNLQNAVDELGSSLVAERYVRGDELALFLYDPAQVERNRTILSLPEDDPRRRELEAENQQCENEALFAALRAGIMLKNAWLSAPVNFERVRSRHLPFDIGIGIHNGLCLLRQRSDGTARIEGYAINFAKRIEGYSRTGVVTRMMLSRTATQRLRFVRRRNVVMRQRLGFIYHRPQGEELKGLQAGLELFELKFFHKLAIYPPPEKIEVFEQLLRMDPTSLWAYQMAAEHYAYRLGELDKARELALMARAARPESEKIYYDLATIAREKGELEEAWFLAEKARSLNPDWDLVYGLLADLASAREGESAKALYYQRSAYALCPDSPQRCWDLGEAYWRVGDRESAKLYLGRAVALCPELLRRDDNLALAQELGVPIPDGIDKC